MGSEVSTQFLGVNISEVTGTKVNSKQFPGSVDIAVAMYNPAIALHDKLGEVRLAIERFGKEVRRMRNNDPPIFKEAR
jgi:acyl carrier protein phosphodiesterase